MYEKLSQNHGQAHEERGFSVLTDGGGAAEERSTGLEQCGGWWWNLELNLGP